MSRKAWLGSLVAFIAAVVLIFSSRAISEFLFGLFFNSQTVTKSTPIVATLTSKDGLIYARRAGQPEFIKIDPNHSFYHLDQIKVEHNARAEVQFPSDWKLNIQENSIMTFELYRPNQENSPALLSITRGDYSLAQAGTKGQLFVMRDKKILSAELKVSATPFARKVELNAQTKLTPLATESTLPLDENAPNLPTNTRMELPTAMTPGKMPDKLKHYDEETLSSSYIEQVLGSQSNSLRKCQMSSLRDNKTSSGALLINIVISPNGKVDHVKLIQDKINNSQLSSCVLSVIERTVFKTFDGQPITLSYPIEFK